MTEEQILQMIKEYFKEGGIRDDGSCSEYYGDLDAFLKFARVVYTEGVKVGYDEGWESNNVSTKMNTWSSDDDCL